MSSRSSHPGAGDPARSAGPFPDGEPNGESSPPFLYLNTGKRSITLDIACKTGQSVLSRLVQSSDVLVHDFRPREADSLGLDFATLNQLKSTRR